MAGIYLHIPFCKQKCSYCNFHFSTDLNGISKMIDSICKELDLRKTELMEPVETIYLGGGTPSLLNFKEINLIFESIFKNYSVVSNPEVTLEANPDDLSFDTIKKLKSTPINRFSIGIQSFFDEDLNLMNRAHNAEEAIFSVKTAQDFGFENLTIDLIYGSPLSTDEIWTKNLGIALELRVPHISSYALTVEPKTVLDHQIQTKIIPEIDEEKQARQFQILVDTLTANDFIHYEISNFGKSGFLSQHNSNYWKGKPYLGIGPSAHSYDGKNRSWNIPNNSIYLKKINQNELPSEVEVLSKNDQFNELVMIRLRMKEGLNSNEIIKNFPSAFYDDFLKEIQLHLDNETVYFENGNYKLSEKGKFLADGIAASLFRI